MTSIITPAARGCAADNGGMSGHDKAVPEALRRELAVAIRALLRRRRPEATICPSEAARVAGGESWRDLMDPARQVAAELARAGVITVRQHGAEVNVTTAVGPVRLARGPRWEEDDSGPSPE
jgi:hypothetical protein